MSHSDHAVEELFISDLSDEHFGANNEEDLRLMERRHRLSVVAWIAAGFTWGCVVAIVAASAISMIAARTAAETDRFVGRPVPAFTLPNLDGEPVCIETKKRQFIIVTSANCKDLRKRTHVDRIAAKIASSNGIVVTNLLAFPDLATAREFASEFKPYADHLLLDDGSVAVEQYPGSEDACWIVVEDERVIWQGRADLNQIAHHLVR